MNASAIRQARLGLGLTQESMAERLGLSVRHYKRLESGATPVSQSLARLVAYETSASP